MLILRSGKREISGPPGTEVQGFFSPLGLQVLMCRMGDLDMKDVGILCFMGILEAVNPVMLIDV